MTVYILIREDQNEYGYIDTSIVGVYTGEARADQGRAVEMERARAEGSIAEEDESPDGEWQVSSMIRVPRRGHVVSMTSGQRHGVGAT